MKFIFNNDLSSEENTGFSEEISKYFLNLFIKMTENSIEQIKKMNENQGSVNSSQDLQKNDETSKIHGIKKKYLNELIIIKKYYQEIKEMNEEKDILWKKLEEYLKKKVFKKF